MREKHTLSPSILTDKLVTRFLVKVNQGDGDSCHEWNACRIPDGYGHFTFNDPQTGKRRDEYSHRLAFLIAYRVEIPAGMVVMHTCDNPPCCNPNHLRLGTFAENSQDRERKGRGRKFPHVLDRHPEAIDLYASGMSYSQIGQHFGVSNVTVWKWLKERGVQLRQNGWAQQGMPARKMPEILGMGRSAVTVAEKYRWRRLYEEGCSITQIATMENRQRSTVHDALAWAGTSMRDVSTAMRISNMPDMTKQAA